MQISPTAERISKGDIYYANGMYSSMDLFCDVLYRRGIIGDDELRGLCTFAKIKMVSTRFLQVRVSSYEERSEGGGKDIANNANDIYRLVVRTLPKREYCALSTSVLPFCEVKNCPDLPILQQGITSFYKVIDTFRKND